MSRVQIIHGETPSALEELADESIDACVTDPPYGIGFMGKEWDTFKPKDVEHQRRRARIRAIDSLFSEVT